MEVIEDGVVMCVGKVRKAEIHARFKKKDKRKGFMMMAKGKMVYTLASSQSLKLWRTLKLELWQQK